MDSPPSIANQPKFAPIKYRFSAGIVDLLVLAFISFIIFYFFGEPYESEESSGYRITGWPAALLFGISFGVICIQEGLTGKTIGKRIVKIKVLKADFSESSISTSILRHVFDMVDMFLFVGFLVAANTDKKQRVGDLIAKTVVVMD